MSDENVQVVVKIRPLIQREIKKCMQIQWAVDDNTIYQKDGKINYQFGKKLLFYVEFTINIILVYF